MRNISYIRQYKQPVPMHNLRILIIAILFGVIFTACKKSSKDNTDVTFVNNVSKDVTVDIYSNIEDYTSNANVFLRKVLQPGEKSILPGNTFKTGQTYYMDWYTDDYYYTNWFNDTYSVGNTSVAIKPVTNNNTYYCNPEFQGTGRITFLNKTASSTVWRAVGAYTEGSSGYIAHWNDLNANEQYREVTVSKNFTAQYNYKDASGNIVTNQLSFMVHNSKDAYIEFMGADGKSQGYISAGRLPTSTKPEYASTATDSVMAYLPNSDLYFLMVRE
jgi:hypothetical protein